MPCFGIYFIDMSGRRIEIAPSILSADFSDIREAVGQVEASGAGIVHFDIMDGVFVPQITFGPKLVKDIRPHSSLVFDAHLMITAPESQIDRFIDAGCDYITIHQESTIHLHRALTQIRNGGARCGISIVPSTPVSSIVPLLDMVDLVLVMTVNPGFGGQKLIQSCLDKIVQLAEIRKAEDFDFLISVDGGVNLDTIQDVVAAGADIAVTGSAFFDSDDRGAFIRKMHELALESFS